MRGIWLNRKGKDGLSVPEACPFLGYRQGVVPILEIIAARGFKSCLGTASKRVQKVGESKIPSIKLKVNSTTSSS